MRVSICHVCRLGSLRRLFAHRLVMPGGTEGGSFDDKCILTPLGLDGGVKNDCPLPPLRTLLNTWW